MGAAAIVGPQVVRVLHGRANVEQVKKITTKVCQEKWASQTTLCKVSVNQSQVIDLSNLAKRCTDYCDWADKDCKCESAGNCYSVLKDANDQPVKDDDGEDIKVPCAKCDPNATVEAQVENKSAISGITMSQEASIDSKCLSQLSSSTQQQTSVNLKDLQEQINSIMQNTDNTRQVVDNIIKIRQSLTVDQMLQTAQKIDQNQMITYCTEDGQRLVGSGVVSGPIFMEQKADVVSRAIGDLITQTSQWGEIESIVEQKAAKGQTLRSIMNYVSIGAAVLTCLLILYWVFKLISKPKE